jgi:hypothetical protein
VETPFVIGKVYRFLQFDRVGMLFRPESVS